MDTVIPATRVDCRSHLVSLVGLGHVGLVNLVGYVGSEQGICFR